MECKRMRRAMSQARRKGGAGGRSERLRRRVLAVAAVATASLSVVACGSSGGSGASSNSPYIVGVVAAFNGPLAITGVGAEQALKVFSSQHGGKLAGHPLEVVPINDQSIGANAIPAFRAYLANHPKPTALIVANSVSAVALAPTIQELHVPMFVVGEDDALEKYTNVEQIQPPQVGWAQSATKYMAAHGLRTFAFMGPAAPSFDILLADFEAGAKANGIVVDDVERPSFTATDFQGEVQRIVAHKPAAAVVTVFGTGFITAVRELREDGYTGQIIFGDTSLTPQAITLPALQGGLDIGWHASPAWGSLAKAFYDYYQVHFHTVPGLEVDDYEAVAELNAVIPGLLAAKKPLTASNIMPAIIAHPPLQALQGSTLSVDQVRHTIIPVSFWKLDHDTFTQVSSP